MKHIARFTLFITALMPAARLLADETCDFEKEVVLQELLSTAKANPGGVLDPNNQQVTWRDVSGKTVQIGYGGCVDLGSSVVLSFPDHIDTRTAVRELILATAKYWSPNEANEISRILSTNRFTTDRPAPGIIEFEASQEMSQTFPFGFTLTVQSKEAGLSWQQL